MENPWSLSITESPAGVTFEGRWHEPAPAGHQRRHTWLQTFARKASTAGSGDGGGRACGLLLPMLAGRRLGGRCLTRCQAGELPPSGTLHRSSRALGGTLQMSEAMKVSRWGAVTGPRRPARSQHVTPAAERRRTWLPCACGQRVMTISSRSPTFWAFPHLMAAEWPICQLWMTSTT
jgi:hypothetical protein